MTASCSMRGGRSCSSGPRAGPRRWPPGRPMGDRRAPGSAIRSRRGAGGHLFASAFGFSVAAAGDVNGDGFGDVIVGAPLFDNAGFPDEGRVFVYAGPLFDPNGQGTTNPIWTFDSNKTQAQLGYSVAGAGDVNGNGIA